MRTWSFVHGAQEISYWGGPEDGGTRVRSSNDSTGGRLLWTGRSCDRGVQRRVLVREFTPGVWTKNAERVDGPVGPVTRVSPPESHSPDWGY